MTIHSDDELQGLEAVGRIVARVLDAMEDRARAGVTTAELDEVAARSLAAQGARSAPRLVYDFPGYTCISVDDEVVHGVPGERLLRRGDLVKLDVTVEKDGFMADAARTVLVEGRGGPGAHLAAAGCSWTPTAGRCAPPTGLWPPTTSTPWSSPGVGPSC
jgi:methionyl aminopeptidase